MWIEKQDLLSGVFLHRLRRQAPAPQTPPSLPLACLSPSLLFPTVPGRMSVTSLLDIEAFVIRGPCQIWSSQIAMNALNKPSHFIISCYLDLPMLNWTAYLFKSKKKYPELSGWHCCSVFMCSVILCQDLWNTRNPSQRDGAEDIGWTETGSCSMGLGPTNWLDRVGQPIEMKHCLLEYASNNMNKFANWWLGDNNKFIFWL